MSKAILEAIKKKKCKRCKYFYDCDVFTWCEKDIKKGRQPTKLICFKFKKRDKEYKRGVLDVK